jgi:hypothetical protein
MDRLRVAISNKCRDWRRRFQVVASGIGELGELLVSIMI